jgi:hypothetical protein
MVILLTAVVVFTLSVEVVWPLYWFIVLGVVHLYAIVFTRGAALSSAAWVLSGVTAASVVWALTHTLVPTAGIVGALVRTLLQVLPVLAWLLITLYMFRLGRQALSKIEIASSYFLAAATLTLGFWGVWLFYLENGLVTTTIYQVALAVGPLLPALCLVFLLTLGHRSGWERSRWLLSLGAFALVALAANLILIEPIVASLGFILGRFFPRLVGLSPLSDVVTQWLGGRGWRTMATSVILLVAIALVVVQAALDTARSQALGTLATDDRDSGAIPLARVGPRQVIVGEIVPGGEASVALARVEPPAPAVVPPGGAVEDAVDEATFAASYLGETAYRTVMNIVHMLSRAVHAVLSPVAFSLLSMLIVMVLARLDEYLRHGPFLDAVSLWAMVVTILVVSVLLCTIAFDFAPPQDGGLSQGEAQVDQPPGRPRILGVPVVVVAAGTLLTSLAYFMVSILSWALLPMVRPSSNGLMALVLGDPYMINLAISTVALGLLAVLYAVGRDAKRGTGRRSRLPGRLLGVPAAVTLVAVACVALSFAATPIWSTFAYVTGPYSPTAVQALRDNVPIELAASCRNDDLLVLGQVASLACRDVAGTNVSYHSFDTAEKLERWYRTTVRARGLAIGIGSCAQRWPAENQYSGPSGSGRVACYVALRHEDGRVSRDTPVKDDG